MPPVLVLDLEGMQGRERGSAAFDVRTAAFAVAAADGKCLLADHGLLRDRALALLQSFHLRLKVNAPVVMNDASKHCTLLYSANAPVSPVLSSCSCMRSQVRLHLRLCIEPCAKQLYDNQSGRCTHAQCTIYDGIHFTFCSMRHHGLLQGAPAQSFCTCCSHCNKGHATHLVAIMATAAAAASAVVAAASRLMHAAMGAVVIVNIWAHDLERGGGAGIDVFKTVYRQGCDNLL